MMLETTIITCLVGMAMAMSMPITPRSWCMDETDGKKLALRYADLISAFMTDKAEALLSDRFGEISDSINALSGRGLGSITFGSKQAFIDEMSKQPSIPMVIKSTPAVTCNTVVALWTQTVGTAAEACPVEGISVLGAAMVDDDYRLDTIDTEFNSLIYAQDLVGNCSLPTK